MDGVEEITESRCNTRKVVQLYNSSKTLSTGRIQSEVFLYNVHYVPILILIHRRRIRENEITLVESL